MRDSVKDTEIYKLAQKYFGERFAGLTCNECSLEEFREWAKKNKNFTSQYVVTEMYCCAVYVWTYFE